MSGLKHDAFLGTWLLDPTRCDYEFGEPPDSGSYRLEATETGYLISMTWITAAGEAHSMAYKATPDGKQYPYENPAVAEAASMTRVGERQLDSATFKGGQQIAHAARFLSADEQSMTVIQSGFGPDGKGFRNTAVYIKQ